MMKKKFKNFARRHFPWLMRLNRPVRGFMAKMNPGIRPEDGEVIFFENGMPFLFQDSRHQSMETLGGSRCGLWDGLLFFSRPELTPARLVLPLIQYASKKDVRSSPALAALCAEFTPRTVAGFVAPHDTGDGCKLPENVFRPAGGEEMFPARLEALLEREKPVPPYGATPRHPHFVLVTHGLSSGGAERQWCYLACELARRGHTVSLLVDNLREQNAHYLPLLAGSTVAIHALETFLLSPDAAFRVPGGVPFSVSRYAHALHFLRPTHVLCQLDYPNLIAGAGALLAGGEVKKVLLSFRNASPRNFSYIYLPWMLPWYRAMLRSPRLVLSGNSATGNADYAAWLGVPEARINCIPNALRTDATRSIRPREETRRHLGITKDAPVILGVFRLSPEKNPLLFLRVIQRLQRQYPNLAVLHAGEGHAAEIVREAAHDHGLSQCVRFLGRREDVPDLMAAADVLLLCSDHEGLPNVLLEAQALALPVVTTEAGGARDAVLPGETALTAQCNDLETLVGHCEALLGNPERRRIMGRAGRLFARQHFTPEALANNTLQALGL